jgi:amino acid adenylation domain-containing protein
MDNVPQQAPLEGIAIVGMSGRFPGANNIEQFWDNLVAGRESLTRFNSQQALQAGVSEEQSKAIENQPRGVIQDAEHFDASLFGMNPREAEIMDPQQRLLLEVAWEAFEHAGYDYERPPGPVGVFVGCGINTYQMSNLATRPDVLEQYGVFPTVLLNEKDFLATRLAYRLNLRGPAVNVQTACSTSLVAVCNACQSLLNFECDMAVAGAAHVAFPQVQSLVHAEGGMISQDGHCRPFDHRASGTIFSDGVGAVVLRRLEDAVADGDHVIAVIRGYGLNNDGSDKAGFAAPSVNGQAEAIQIAHALGDTEPESISYVEAHGTGTRLGDPIELAALSKAFEEGTQRKQFCGIGSVKSNIGHLDVAAGVVGLIKTALSLQHRLLPPTINYEAPNREINFEQSPFHVVNELMEWRGQGGPLRAGVSSFGIGGTNAHVVLEEAPRLAVEVDNKQSSPERCHSLLTVSAHTKEALQQATDNLAEHLSQNPDLSLQDAAFTLQSGRHPFAHRCAIVCSDAADAVSQLRNPDDAGAKGAGVSQRRGKPIFMFPGQGSQRVDMGRQLYRSEPVYRKHIDRCAELLMDDLGLDIREAVFAGNSKDSNAADRLAQTSITQPALFVTEYALAQLWMSWGVQPHAMIGHSVGEYTAACLANVFSLPKALHLIAARGRLIQNQPRGSMLAIMRPESECQQFVSERVSIAAVNSPGLCVVSGEDSDIDGIVSVLESESIACRPLMTSHAFHSPMMEPVIEPFAEILNEAELKAPVIPFISNVTGTWITDEQASSPDYWTAHLRQGVMFERGIGTILQLKDAALVEVGPGHTLTMLARQHPEFRQTHTSVISMPRSSGVSSDDPDDGSKEQVAMLTALGEFWEAGFSINWNMFSQGQVRKRVPLPTYPFQRDRHWVEPGENPRRTVQATALESCVSESCVATPDQAAAVSPEKLDGTVDSEGNTSRGTVSGEYSGDVPRSMRVAVVSDDDANKISLDSQVEQTLLQILRDLSGLSDEQLRSSGTWLEKGFDSLFLTQFARGIEQQYKLPITFRKLVEELPNLALLAQFISSRQTHENAVVDVTGSPKTSHAGKLQNDVQIADPVSQRLDEMTRQIQRLTETIEAMRSTPDQRAVSDLRSSGATRSTGKEGVVDAGPTLLPVTDGQREIWLASQMDLDASRTFNESYAVTLEGNLDIKRLEDCLQTLVNRHEALRITFASDGTSQSIHSRSDQHLDYLDFTTGDSPDHSEVANEHRLSGLMQQRISEAFDLQEGPLSRFVLIKTAESRHVLLVVFHHAILDGWSWGILLQELGVLYREGGAVGAAGLKTPSSFEAYLEWTHSEIQLRKSHVDAEYWHSIFKTPYHEFELPSANPRPAEKTYHAKRVVEHIGASLTLRLRDASRTQNCTLFSFLLAGFKAWLQHITQKQDLVVGVPMAGQLAGNGVTVGDASRLVGHCVHMLPIRSQCSPDDTFAEFLKRLNGIVLDGRDHQNFTFGNLLETMPVKRDASRVPIISASFNLATAHDCDLGKISTHVLRPAKEFNYFDLTLDVIDRGDCLELECKFNRDLYEADTVCDWLSQFQRVLGQVADRPDRKIADLQLISELDQDFLLNELNATAAEYDRESTLHDLIRKQARKTPDRTAIRFGSVEITYRELDEQSDALAVYLQEQVHVTPDALVGVSLDRSIEMVIALLAVMKSGAAYIPLDPSYPPERIAYVLQNAGAVCIITDSCLQQDHQALPASAIMLDEVLPRLKSVKREPEKQLGAAGNLAYVIYTSGSTGKPKGVQIEHRAVVNFLQSMQEEPGLQEQDVLLAVTTVSFDIAVLELYLPLLTGATIVLATRDDAMDAVALARLIEDQSISVMQATPATYRMLVQTGWTGKENLKLLCGGEPLPAELAIALLPKCGELWNMYGPTETTVWSTCCRVRDGHDIHIGRPINNTQIYIVDRNFNPTPVGVAGELLIGGDGLARGYLGKPDLTREKFIDSPFVRGHKVYRTGDLARYRQDGTVDCLGRLDFQVKVRGFRIELGEIETILNELDSIRQAVVIAEIDESGEGRLIAHVVPDRSDSSVTPDDLRVSLRGKLPEYMVPSLFNFLEDIPCTPNGKVDRNALPTVAAQTAAGSKGREPVTRVEKILVEIWAKHLRLENVDIDTSFFDLGGHSLLAVSVFHEISQQLDVHVPLGSLIRASTIGELAKLVDEMLCSEVRTSSSLIPLTRDPNKQGSEKRDGLYLVHGAGGDVLLYQKLIQHLGEQQAVFGLQSKGLDGDTEPLKSIGEMAQCYTQEILAQQPEGPYRLAGYCLGGTIAFEIARQLQAAGHQVEMVALLDTYNFTQMKRPGFISVFSQRVYFHVRNLLRTEFKRWPSYFSSKLQVIRNGELRLLVRATLPWLFGSTDKGNVAEKPPVLDLNQAAAFAYVPTYYPGTVTLITPRTNYSFFPDEQMGWGTLADGLEIIKLDVLPHAMLEEPGVEKLAESLLGSTNGK